MLTTKPTAMYNSKPAMRCRRCNKIGHKAAQCRSKWYTGHRRSDGQPHKARDCPHRYDCTSKRARIVEDEAPQRKFEGKMYMLRTSGQNSNSCDMDKYKIALNSGATTHVMNASSLVGSVEVMDAPSTIRTMTSNLSANVGILKDVIVMENNNLDMNLALVARYRVSHRI